MRERLTAAFILASLLLLLGAGAVRTYVQRDLVREQAADRITHQVALVADLLTQRLDDGQGVDEAFLRTLVDTRDRLAYERPDRALSVEGAEYAGGTDVVSASAPVGPGGVRGRVTLSTSPSVMRDVIGDTGSVVALFLLTAGIAGLAGYAISSAMSAPFQRLAVAAGALGRGRLDLDLPRTRIPEARAIGAALRGSATALEDRLQRERDFAEHASHVLRTPLTGVRLELEELSLRPDLPDDVRAGVDRALNGAEELSTVAGELVEISRRGRLVAGAELPLAELATQVAQRWADALAAQGRPFSAAVEGDAELTYTPGPVEQVADLLLDDVVRRGRGRVRLVFRGGSRESGGHLRLQASAAERAPDATQEPAPTATRLQEVVAGLGGRVSGSGPAEGVEVLLPRR